MDKRQPKPRILQSQLAVVEGKWGESTNLSVKGLFDILSDINFDSPHAYYYEMFVNDNSLKNIISRIGINEKIKLLYIGAHGDDKNISASGGKITRAKLKNALSELNKGSLHGLFFGTCLFVNKSNAKYLLCPPNNTNPPIKWIAGYRETVEWVDSSALDMLFWNNYFGYTGTANERIQKVATELKRLVPGLVDELGMEIYVRNTGRNTGVKNLLA